MLYCGGSVEGLVVQLAAPLMGTSPLQAVVVVIYPYFYTLQLSVKGT